MSQPFKRFTQCGSLTMLFGVFIVLFGVSSTALTTFGKTNNSPPPTHAPIVKGRECNSHDDCTGIEHSSCVKDPNDYKLRCLCGDDSAPNNGLCRDDVLKGLRHKCNSANECDDGMICQYENANRTIGVAKFMSKTKLCLCDNDNGYVEDVEHDICSGAAMQTQTIANIFFTLLTTAMPFLVYSHMNNHF